MDSFLFFSFLSRIKIHFLLFRLHFRFHVAGLQLNIQMTTRIKFFFVFCFPVDNFKKVSRVRKVTTRVTLPLHLYIDFISLHSFYFTHFEWIRNENRKYETVSCQKIDQIVVATKNYVMFMTFIHVFFQFVNFSFF